jgi:hypothetical protein
MRRLIPLLAAAVLAAAPAHAAPTDDQVRAFVARQEKSRNAGDLAAYFAGFRPDAAFTDQYRTPAGQIVPYGKSTLAQARIQARKFRATSKVTETHRILRITRAPDARSAQVVAYVTATIQGPSGRRVTCAERRQDLVLAGGAVRSKGQVDTFVRCGR